MPRASDNMTPVSKSMDAVLANPLRPVQGVWCAVLTPFDATGLPDHARLAQHVRRILAAGVDGIALFGTTGEGQSLSVNERRAGLDALLAAGIAPARILAATGCASLPETVELTRHAVQATCAGALVLPPFFFKGVTDEGVFASYARVIDAVGDPGLRLYLYHIPQVSGVAISTTVIERLVIGYPAILAGVKDSECSLDHTRRLLSRFRELAIFVGYEPHLPAALASGGAGTICGIANLFPRLLRRLYDNALTADHQDDLKRVETFVAALERYPLFAAFKALQAELTGDDGWAALRPPLLALDRAARRAWLEEVARSGVVTERDAAAAYF
jgi:4-hydroxy-tetrahydrodipicolinate synthase